VPSDRHVTLAWGRDYDDVSPVKGVALGGGAHTVEVSVSVRPEGGDSAASGR
jgi:transglutaminase-like putative cysteine protease